MNQEPQPTTPVPTPQPPVGPSLGKFSKKQIILLASAVGGAILLVLIGLVIYAAVFSVSKADYRQATQEYNTVTKKGNDSIRALSSFTYLSSSTTETKLKNDIEEAKTALADYKTANEAFTGLKAFRDSEVKTKYDAYTKKYEAYVVYADNFLNSIDKVYPAFQECGASNATSTSLSSANLGTYKSAIDACVKALNGSKNVADKDLQTLTTELSKSYTTLNGYIAEYTALATPTTYGSNDYNRAREIRTATYDIDFRAPVTDYTSNATKHSKAADPSDAANDLGQLLSDKQLGK